MLAERTRPMRPRVTRFVHLFTTASKRSKILCDILVVGVTSRGSQTKGRHIYLGWQQQIEQRLPPQTNMAPR